MRRGDLPARYWRLAPDDEFLDRQSGIVPTRKPVLQYLAMRDARMDRRGIEPVHLDVARIAHDQALVRAEHAEPVRHVVDRVIEALVLQAQLALHAGALGDVLAQRDPAPVRHRVIM